MPLLVKPRQKPVVHKGICLYNSTVKIPGAIVHVMVKLSLFLYPGNLYGKLLKLGCSSSRWCICKQTGCLLGFGERYYIPYGIFPAQQHYKPVKPKGQSSVGRSYTDPTLVFLKKTTNAQNMTPNILFFRHKANYVPGKT